MGNKFCVLLSLHGKHFRKCLSAAWLVPVSEAQMTLFEKAVVQTVNMGKYKLWGCRMSNLQLGGCHQLRLENYFLCCTNVRKKFCPGFKHIAVQGAHAQTIPFVIWWIWVQCDCELVPSWTSASLNAWTCRTTSWGHWHLSTDAMREYCNPLGWIY